MGRRILADGREAVITEVIESHNNPTQIIGRYLCQRKPGKYFITSLDEIWSESYIPPSKIELLE